MITRLFETVSGGMITWLIPAALLLGTLAMIPSRAPRTDGIRAAMMIWGGWLLVTGLVFSFMAGTYHEYYTVALAPAIAALVAIGGQVLWQHRMRWLARIGLAVTMIITAVWAFLLLERATAAYQVLQWPVLILGWSRRRGCCSYTGCPGPWPGWSSAWPCRAARRGRRRTRCRP